RDSTPQDGLWILMAAAQHFYKVLDEHTILVAADTPQNRRAYEDLVIQTFFLSNADVKDVMTMLRTLVDAKKLAANERLNAIILRDSLDHVKGGAGERNQRKGALGGGGRRRAAADRLQQGARARHRPFRVQHHPIARTRP